MAQSLTNFFLFPFCYILESAFKNCQQIKIKTMSVKIKLRESLIEKGWGYNDAKKAKQLKLKILE